jgi:hypothetical protein
VAIGDDVAVQVLDWPAGRDGGLHKFVAEQRVEADIAAGLIGKQVRLPRRAQLAVLAAVHGDALKIGGGEGRIGGRLRRL